MGFTVDVADCSTSLFLPLVPTFLPLDTGSLPLLSLCHYLLHVPQLHTCHSFWGIPFPTTSRSWDESLANVTSPDPYKPTMLNVVCVKELEEEVVVVTVVGNHDTGEHLSWGQCRRAWGRGHRQGGTWECVGKTELTSVCSLCLCS